jgi:hypothetical protein
MVCRGGIDKMKLLVTASMPDLDKLPSAVEKVKIKTEGKAQVISGNNVPWESILVTEGNWNAVYDWVARVYDGLVLLETEEDALGRGTYEMAKRFITAGKTVGVLRGDEVKEVKDVRVFNKNNWRNAYGIVVTNG